MVNSETLAARRDELVTLIDSFMQDEAAGHDTSRQRLDVARLCDRIKFEVEDPFLRVWKITNEGYMYACIRIAIDLGVFKLVARSSSMTAADIARMTGAEHDLVVRIMRVLTASGFLNELGEERYSRTSTSDALASDELESWYKATWDTGGHIGRKLPEYLKARNYHLAQGSEDSPSHFTFGMSYFDRIHADPERTATFGSAMNFRSRLPSFQYPDYPYNQLWDNDNVATSKSEMAFVDVGGGKGHALRQILKQCPSLRSHLRLIVQDLPHVIAGSNDEFEFMAYDFYKPQPLKGARCYFFRQIFHDWSDADCSKILRNTVQAMAPGFSKLLIVDQVLPDVGCDYEGSTRDIAMMTMQGKERTEKQWHRLLEAAGVRIGSIVRAEDGSLAVIEAVVDG